MNIEMGELCVTRCCRSPFLLTRKDCPDRCGGCNKENPEMFTPWFSDDTDMMFELISDVRKGAK